MIKRSTMIMKHGQSICVQHAHVEQVSSIVQWFNVRHIHIVDICTNRKMNVVQNVEVDFNFEKMSRKMKISIQAV